MKIKSLWNWIKVYTRRHTFHMVMLVALCLLGAAQFSQYAISGSIYGMISMNQKTFDDYTIQNAADRETERQDLLKAISGSSTESTMQLQELKMELNSRIDILDSAIKPEKKRRMLIVKVRNAITENTETKLTIRELNNIAVAVIDYSFKYNLSIAKVLAQMKQESNFVIKARSRAKADGLMQVIPETWEYIVLKEFDRKKADPHNIFHNIKAGCFYMSEQVHKFDTYDQALMAYNWGPHRVRELLADEITEEDMPKETRDYLLHINENIEIFEAYGLE